MKSSKVFKLTAIAAVFALALVGCSKPNAGTNTPVPTSSPEATSTPEVSSTPEITFVEVTDIHGTVTVPVNPQNVVALDNRTFETLSDWGIELAAVPKGVMPADSVYVGDESVQDIGNHWKPPFNQLSAMWTCSKWSSPRLKTFRSPMTI